MRYNLLMKSTPPWSYRFSAPMTEAERSAHLVAFRDILRRIELGWVTFAAARDRDAWLRSFREPNGFLRCLERRDDLSPGYLAYLRQHADTDAIAFDGASGPEAA